MLSQVFLRRLFYSLFDLLVFASYHRYETHEECRKRIWLIKDMHNIVLRSKEGDMSAFEQLVKHYQDYAFALALRLLGDEEEAGDAVQETFIRVWKHMKSFDMRSKFSTWLYRVVTNLCFDRLKARKRRQRVIAQNPDKKEIFETGGDHDLEDDHIKKELADLIMGLADELTPKQRIVFVLRDLQDLDIKEVSHIAGMSVGSVKSNLYYARQSIRQRLEEMNLMGGN